MSENKNKKFSIGKLLIAILVILLVVLLCMSLFKKDDSSNNDPVTRDFFTDYYNSLSSGYSGNWKLGTNVGVLNDKVASNVKAKRTQILGSNKDIITIMVYMCGSDLESKNAMGVYDLQEMAAANLSDNINLIVYTGGTTKWHTNAISTQVNQIYRVHKGGIEQLVSNAGTGSMVDPSTLTSFIEWCADNYEANRYELIMWDHGSGSVGGYGYDEKYPKLGSMSLAQMDKALTDADVAFDFVAFDACLMGNLETGLMLAEHADYLIGSEEAEPGIGWYYTDWLNALSKNTSMPTIEIGKAIADSFVAQCGKQTPGQSATLSVVDLAELSATIPSKLSAYSSATSELIKSDFKTVAKARSGSREFAASAYSDLVDLVDMASTIGTSEASELVEALLSCIKYNNTSRDMYNSYGLSVYFPYRSTRYINSTLNLYEQIDMNEEYTECVRNFATYATSGQISSGGSHNAYQSFNSYGQGYGNNTNGYDYYYTQQGSSDLVYDLLSLLLSGHNTYSNSTNYQSYYADDLFSLLFGRGIDRSMTQYIADNHFDGDLTVNDGKIALSEKQLSMIDSIEYNVFIDDGTGFIDLGKDNVFDYDEEGNLIAPEDNTWLAISNDNSNWQVIPYYFTYSIDDNGSLISYGTVPVKLNGSDANLLLYLDDESIEIVGATYTYDDVDVIAKNLEELSVGDELEFVCDYYDYDGNYLDSYILGDKFVVGENTYIGDISIDDYKTLASYEIKDIYQQSYWSTPLR